MSQIRKPGTTIPDCAVYTIRHSIAGGRSRAQIGLPLASVR
jgi:hypothetical protein